MSTPQVIVHIGTPKTGTTSIQAALFAAQAQLLAQTGTLIPSQERAPGDNRHLSVAHAVEQGRKAADAEFAALLAEFEASGAKRMLITDEGLSSKPRCAAFFQRFRDAGFAVQVICYLRRWDYYVESLYSQVFKLSGLKGGVPPINAFWRDARVQKRCDYVAMLQPWTEVATRLDLIDFQRAAAQGGLLDSFAATAGLTAAGDLPQLERNVSYDIRAMQLLATLAGGSSPGEIKKLAAPLTAAIGALIKDGVVPRQSLMLGAADRAELLAQMVGQADALNDRYQIQFDMTLPIGEAEPPMAPPNAQFVLALLGALTPELAQQLHAATQRYVVAQGGQMVSAQVLEKLTAVDADEIERRRAKAERRAAMKANGGKGKGGGARKGRFR